MMGTHQPNLFKMPPAGQTIMAGRQTFGDEGRGLGFSSCP
jgi:hypothetical protein